MPTYVSEATDIPALFMLRPVYNAAQAITAANAQVNFSNRTVNNIDNTDIIIKETTSMTFDMLGAKAGSIVNVAGLGNITVAQTAAAIKKIADALRAGTL